MRGCLWLQAQQQSLLPFATALFEAYWGRDEDISRDDVLAGICARCGIDAAAFAAGIGEAAVKAQLKANTDELIARGGFGSPTIFVNGDDMYFGNDRLPLIRQALRRAVSRR
jgi:2-hydroxychromene-2-carboxylate isomerase